MQLTYKHTARACYLGFITQAISVNLAPLLFVIFQTSFQISLEQIGRLILINFGTQILADLFATRYVDRIGYRPCVCASMLLSVVGLWGLGVLPRVFPSPYAGLVTAIVVYSWGSGLIEVLISPIMDSLPGDAKAAAMSLTHSFYCWGQMGVVLLSTLAIRLLGEGVWVWLPFFWSVVPLFDFFVFLKAPLMPVVPADQKTPLRTLFSSRSFLLAMLLMIASGSSELTMSQWSSLFAEKGLGVSKLMGDLLGPCLFAMFMGIGRALYGVVGERVNLRGALLVSGALAVVCYATTVFSPLPLLSLAGCALSGFSVALMWPGTLSLTAARFPMGGTTMFGLLAVCGDIGGSIGPWLAGLVGDLAQNSPALMDLAARASLDAQQVGLRAGLLVCTVFPLMLFLVLIAFGREARRA